MDYGRFSRNVSNVSEEKRKIAARALLTLISERALGQTAIRSRQRRAPIATSLQPKPSAAPLTRPAPTTVARVAESVTASASISDGFAHLAAPAPAFTPRVVPRAQAAPTAASATTLPLLQDAPFTSPVLSTQEKVARLKQVAARIAGCTNCTLCEQRSNTVPGEGNVDTLLMFVGEGPGETEDQTGRPFVGKAGELLEKQIAAMGLTREQVFIANVVKCRPPGNRTPTSAEVATCAPFLVEQIEIVRPRVIVALGLPATKFFLRDDKIAISRVRGTWREWRGIRVMPTFHPAHLLRNYSSENRRAVWSDLQQVMAELGLPGEKKAE